MTLAAAAAIAAAAGVAVVAAAFALFALLVPATGAAGAGAIVAAVAACLVALAGLIAAGRAKEGRRRQQEYAAAADPGLIVKLFELAKQRPFVAAGAAAAAGIFALRNPVLVAAVIKAFFDAPAGPPPGDRHR